MKVNNKMFPIIIVEIYLTMTVLLFILGPWDFIVSNPIQLYVGLFFYQIMLLVGYKFGTYIKIKKNKSFTSDKNNIRLIKIMMIIYSIILLISIIRELGLTSLNINALINKIIEGIKTPSSGYYSKLKLTNSSIFLGKLGTFIMVMAAPISYVILPLMIVYFKNFSKTYKVFAIFLIGMYVVKYIATGTNKGVFDIIIIIISIIFLNSNIKNEIKKAKNTKRNIIILILIIMACFSFNYTIGSRSFGVNLNKNTKLGNMISLKEESKLLEILPERLEKPLILLSSYLCQGYYGLSLSMKTQFTPMLGVGSSLFLVDKISEITDINRYTVQKKVEEQYGWNSRVQWFTLYSWIANDVGFIGVGFYMFLLGVIFSIIYKDILINNNIIAKVLFSLFMIQFIFIPANNQLMVNINSLCSTIFSFILWIVSKKIKIRIR